MCNKGGVRYAVVSFLVQEVILPRTKNLLNTLVLLPNYGAKEPFVLGTEGPRNEMTVNRGLDLPLTQKQNQLIGTST